MIVAIKALPVTSQQKISLKHARSQLRLTQTELAARAKVHPNVIRNCEKGRGPMSLISAYAILGELNKARTHLNMASLNLDDLDWNVKE